MIEVHDAETLSGALMSALRVVFGTHYAAAGAMDMHPSCLSRWATGQQQMNEASVTRVCLAMLSRGCIVSLSPRTDGWAVSVYDAAPPEPRQDRAGTTDDRRAA